ncbi:signal recognition particle-docking protein FtsY [Neisseria elongata]|uniref:signal recognition particle-docking protein FtsY n=1 Tax=Neisseria elongata TaxID=495 RepID=UPI0009E42EA8|nr:signal recognition particle-docking protein FtsY [Neisseria elongata]
MALFDFLFKRKKDEPQSAAEDRPSENPPAEEAAESAEPPEPSPQADTAEADTVESEPLSEREAFLRDIRNADRSSLLSHPAQAGTAADAENSQPAAPAEAPVPTQEPETLSDGLRPENEAETAEEPAEQESVEEEPVEEKEQPSETQPAEEQPTEVRHAEEQPEQEPAAEKAPTVEDRPAEEQPAETGGWAARLKQGLSKSRDKMAKSLAGVFGGGKIDEGLYEELETVLLTSDMGIEATEHLMDEVRRRVSLKGLSDGRELRQALKEAVYDLLAPLEKPLEIPDNGQPFVIMMAGINGAGKTTSIGKLAKYFQSQGKSVILAAGDTFRAAAREQLQEWGERNGVTVISQAKGDSAAVCFDAVEAAKARKIDIVLADTAGRLPTQLHLMEEIKKVKRVLQKSMPDAPHEIIVVLDANIGQNAVNQVVAFDDALGVTGLIVTKLDGTAKGGVLAALASSRPIPVRYIGVGEKIDDLRPFDARAFVDALIDN